MPATSALPPRQAAGLQVRVRGGVSDAERDCAGALISAVLARHHDAVADSRVRLSGARCVGGPGVVQVNLRLYGAPARIQVAGPTMTTAIATAATRLQRQLNRLAGAWEQWPWPDPERRPLGVPGPATISRVKSFRLLSGTPCQAVARMTAMDYDVFLYTDVDTGEDAIVYRSGPTGLCLARQHTMRPASMPVAMALTVNPRKVAVLTATEAASHLADGWLPFVFYTDRDTRRGHLLYRRYDGRVGMIIPALTASSPIITESTPSRRLCGDVPEGRK